MATLLAIGTCPPRARADCSLTTTGNVPLPDLGPRLYQNFAGGLYPNGSNTRPPDHEAAGVALARQVQPLDSLGRPEPLTGRIVLISVGLSNTTQEFATKGAETFQALGDADPNKNPRLLLVDGAQGGQDAVNWLDLNAPTWDTVDTRLAQAGVTPLQVQVVWLKQALIEPGNYGAFPAHAQALQADLEIILRNIKIKYPNVKLAYLSSRTRAYSTTFHNPEPYAYESGFSVQWTIADQIHGTGNLNFDSTLGLTVAPWLSWGPYLWTDGDHPRSDGFIWPCSDLDPDFVHPSANGGVPKVADQLLAFFETDPTATPWFLSPATGGQVPGITAVGATPSNGTTDLVVQFNAAATNSDAKDLTYVWTFDDGTYSYAQNPAKLYTAAGTYNAHLTVTDSAGGYANATVPVTVSVGSTALLNVSTRVHVDTGEGALIGGFIVTGSGTKKVMLRAIGPSLTQQGVAGALADPALELHDSTGAIVATNDNWQTTQLGGLITGDQTAAINATGIAPARTAESAIIAEVSAGAYTAVMHGVGNATGVGLAEVYDLDQASPAKIANISSRALVQSGLNVLIGGFIVAGPDSSTMVVRALGPSLAAAGVGNTLADPTLELHDDNGALLASDDNWTDSQAAALQVTGLAPSDSREAAIVRTLAPGNYTAVVAGRDGGMGVGLVEVYKLQ